MLDKIDFQAWRQALVTMLRGASQEQNAAADAYNGANKCRFDQAAGKDKILTNLTVVTLICFHFNIPKLYFVSRCSLCCLSISRDCDSDGSNRALRNNAGQQKPLTTLVVAIMNCGVQLSRSPLIFRPGNFAAATAAQSKPPSSDCRPTLRDFKCSSTKRSLRRRFSASTNLNLLAV